MNAPSSTAQAGMVLGGRYELVSTIAAGGMAQVWRGRDLALTRPVAVKILHPHLGTDHAFVTRFRREALASARLSHPSIVAVYDTMSEQGIEAIVMELVEGRTLRSVLDEAGFLPPPDVVDIGVQISDALDVAHRAGIVHRDIKPANIMVGTDRRIMVTDFGIAKATKDDDLTHTGTLLGTAKYLAPEQVTGEPVDPRADIYALGVVLFEAATGGPPFLAETDAATALARLREDAPRCRERRADVPVALDEIIAKAMARHPDQRYDRALSLRSALDRVDLTRVGPVPADLSTLPPPVERTAVQAQPGALPQPGLRPQPPATPPTPSSGPVPAGPGTGTAAPKPKRGERKAKKQADRAEAKRANREAKEAKRRKGRQRPTRTLAAVLIIGGLVLAGALLASLGGRDTGVDIDAPIAIAEAIPFDPEGPAPFTERNDLAPLAIDSDPETVWRTDGYARAGLGGGLKSGVGLILVLDGERSLEAIDLDVISQEEWRVEVYVGDGDFGENGEDFEPDTDPVAVLDNSSTGASLDGATGSHVLLWITETGVLENDSWGRPGLNHRFVLSEVALA